MELNQILANLCYYDQRNPDGTKDTEEIAENERKINSGRKRCPCDNCDTGRSELAEYILTLKHKDNEK